MGKLCFRDCREANLQQAVMLQQGVADRSKRVMLKSSMLLVFSVLLVTHSFAQHDPIKEKEERQKRETTQPKVVLPHYKPPKNRVLIPIKVSNPANIAGQPSLPPPVLPPEPTMPTASTVPPPPPGFSN